MQKLKNKKCSVIIQARLNSTRYKSKILKKINNLTILEILIRRLKKSKKINKIIIAFPMNNIDDKLVNVCKKLNILFYRGPELNVLKRYYLAAKKFKLKDIARITSDCPLIDVSVFDKLVDKYFSSKFDYASNVVNPTYPDGMDIEIFNFKTLKDQYLNHSNKINNEHVTTGMMANKNYKICSLTLKKDYSNLKLSLDTPYDLKILSKVIKKFKNNIYIKLENILNLYDQDPNFFEKNMKVLRNEGGKLNIGQKNWIRAQNIIPGGTMLFSKNPDLMLPKKWPAYYSKAKDSYIWDLEKKKYLDFYSMGIGTNILGYCRKEIDNAVIQAIKKSNMSTLNSIEEINLAEKLIEMHPWAEMARFTRSGGEANAVAIRIARAACGKENIAVCGYHGWHDWYLASNLSNKNNLDTHLMRDLPINGVSKKLKNSVFTFDFNDFEQLNKLVKEKNIGIIKMEVQRLEKPKNNFLQKVRNLVNKNKIILIFDECTSGFRETFGGLHMYYKVKPDICIFGKALGNGYAINAIIGKRNIMESVKSTFISSTFWTERIGSVAGINTLKTMEKIKSWKIIASLGRKLKSEWKKISEFHSVPISITGLDSIPTFTFNTKKNNHHKYRNYLTQEMLKEKILASNSVYLSVAHNQKILTNYLQKLNTVFKKIKDCENENENFNNIFKNELSIKGIRQK